ncbi:MAG: succinylglutamate desuccinylase/aspartoacylase family protein [Duodenibacillus sp.]|nr:succinylglutamate desuccinylase/aspartoacylase family protein [Duodenibacillus sp.]
MTLYKTHTCNGQILEICTIQGSTPGPKILITAGIHGCEYVGIETAKRLSMELSNNAHRVCGCITIIPCVNREAFYARVPALNPNDGLNINRVFPGSTSGSASHILAAMITQLQDESDFYIDMHGGDLHERLSPYVYVPGNCKPNITAIARDAASYVDVPVRVLSDALTGAYNSAAARGTPSILIERGHGGRWSEEEVNAYRKDIVSVLAHLGALHPSDRTDINQARKQREISALYVGAQADGLWYPSVTPDQNVSKGELLGVLHNFDGEEVQVVRAEKDGCVLYMTGTLFAPVGVDLIAY